MISSLRRPSRFIPLAVLLVLAGAAFWFWKGAQSSTLASEDTALADFHARAAQGSFKPRPGVPTPGVYHFRQSGSETAGSGPLTVSRDLPPEAVYIASSTKLGYHEDLRHSQEHVEEVQFAVNPTGTVAVWRRSKVTFLGIGEDDKAAVTPPALDHPADLTVGRKWGSTYVNGKTTVTYHGEVLSKGSVTLDGHAVPTYLLRTDSTFDGPIAGTRRDDVTFAPTLALPVAWKIAQDTSGAADYSIRAELQLESAIPIT
jgi:hypothetical protein